MGRNWKGLGTLTFIGLAAWTSWTVKAQDEPNTRQSLPVEASQAGDQFPPGTSLSQTPMIGPGVPLTRLSSQTSGFSSGAGTKGSVAQLRNPFEWEGSVEKHGLFGWIAPRPAPQYPGLPGKQPGPEPVAPPGGLPGEIGGPGVAQPGAVAAPSGAEAMPGAGGEPGAAPSPGATPGAAPATTAGAGAEAFASAPGTTGPGFGGAPGGIAQAFPMIGDRGPLFLRQSLRFPPVPTPIPPGVPRPGNNPATLTGRSVAAIVPAIRGFKTADNQYPRPVDRVWVSFNYYDGVNSGLNSELGAPIKNMQVYNETFGFEKTFLDQQASLGFRIPVNTLTITSGFPGLSGTHTSTGNFSSFFKYVLWQDNRGNLISGGLDLSFPTGPTSFAGYPTTLGIKSFELQPFLGYIFQRDRYYVQGFTSIAVPTDRNLATMYYFDIQLGYFVYRSQNPRALISAIVPVFETHLNIPLNWAGFQPRFLGSTPDVVDLNWGLNLGLASRAVLSVAYVHPVTGPTPFSGELALQLNVPFGGRPGRNIPFTPPVIGQ
jgi:hypothetical protein